MLREVLDFLDIQPGDCIVDATVGWGGHAGEIIRHLGKEGFFLGLDRDREAVEYTKKRLSGTGIEHCLVCAPFSRLSEVLDEQGVRQPSAVFWDLGVSSPQLDLAERGFSFLRDGPLDMRMDGSRGETAADLVNTWSRTELQDIFSSFGEEKYSGRIARRIVERRPFTSTTQLAGVIAEAVPGGKRGRIHPATRVFQALRIAVNDELKELQESLQQGIGALALGGKAVVLSYHSLEDRIVKLTFKEASRKRGYAAEGPIEHTSPKLEVLTRRPLQPGTDEVASNPRSRSAKLRAAKIFSPPA
jgi:16S rRNA (cytosine1402-N4)-methyltransferase